MSTKSTTTSVKSTKATKAAAAPARAPKTPDLRAYVLVEERPVPKATTMTVKYVTRDTLEAYKMEMGHKSLDETLRALLTLAGYEFDA